MSESFKLGLRRFLLLLVALGGLALTGCKSDEPENLSTRPWNTPKSWESGLPGGLGDRYR